MIEILKETEGILIATNAKGKLTEKDYDKLLPLLNERLKKFYKIRWYFEMEDFEGWSIKAFWEDVKFDSKHFNDFEKIAMVGDKKWEKIMTDLMKPFTAAQVKYFNISEKDKALMWIRE